MATGEISKFYSHEFFAGQADGSANSANVVVPLVLSLIPVKSVVDVGCGIGPWAAEFLARGVTDVCGIDGDYIDRSQLRIPADQFIGRDLGRSISLNRTFNLAVCLEVAEHLPASRARGLVSDLVALAPCVLFSAAIPGQGGTNHINEQYIPYWADLFQEHGYEGIDPIRPRVCGNHAVEWFYQQNIVMFIGPGHPLQEQGFPRAQTVVHPRLYESTRTAVPSPPRLVKMFPGAVVRSIRNRLGMC
jgi:SAM-dependent methyltransferase